MSDNKRLLLVGSTKSDVHLRNYHNLIKDYFDEVLVVCSHPIDFAKCKTLDFGLKNPLKLRNSILLLRKIIQSFKPSVIHAHQANSVGYITSKANNTNIPQVLTIWGSDVLILPNQGRFYRYIVKTALKSSDHITADTSFIENNIEALVGKVKFNTANFGVDLPNIDVDSEKKEKIIYSNRLHDSLYNIDQIIEGFSSFIQEYPGWKLIIGGKGPLTKELKQKCSTLLPKDSFRFVGFVDYDTNMSLYQRASIYISIPASDGTSISLLEAMACGTIPVVSDLPANHEWIQDNQNGIIVNNSVERALFYASKLELASVSKLNQKIIETKATKTANKAIFCKIYDALI